MLDELHDLAGEDVTRESLGRFKHSVVKISRAKRVVAQVILKLPDAPAP
tara:strand:- start:437 stop:583 length:147 start_codon:yes stop_codon:yes gene_type:complete